MTIGHYAQLYDEYLLEHWDEYYEEEPDWNAQIDWFDDNCVENWARREAPEMRAYELLSGLDLGPQLSSGEGVGQLNLEHGRNMAGSCYWVVEAADQVTISLLQERLNALNTGVKIVMG